MAREVSPDEGREEAAHQDENEDVVGRALSVAGAGTGRCMFIAGFAYYEIGRFDFSVGRDDVYLELMTGAFIMSMVSASISGYVQYYMSGLEESNKQTRFALVLDEVVKGNLAIFVLATLLYCATFARIGYSYYPDAHNGYYSAKHVPALGSVVAFTGIMVCIMSTVRSRRDLNCAAVQTRERVGKEVGVSFGWVASITRRWTGNAGYKPSDSLASEPEQSSTKYRSMVEAFLQTADAIADRSIFITGFAQSGLARYCPQGRSMSGTYGAKCMMAPTCITDHAILQAATLGGSIDSLPACGGTNSTCDLLRETCINMSRLAADCYLILITYATVASILAAFVFTILAAAVRELPAHEQATYVWRMSDWRTFGERAGMSSQIALLVALVVLGFGTSVNHAHVNAENISVGGTAIVMFLLSYSRVRQAYNAATSGDSDKGRSSASEGSSRQSTLSSNESRLEALLSQTVPIGNQATIAAGFTFYNVVTFATDIEGLQNLSETRKCFFNLVNVATVAFGIISACLSTSVQIMVTDLKMRYRSGQPVSFEAFLANIDGIRQAIVYSFSISLVGFIVGFGIYGITKLRVSDEDTDQNFEANATESAIFGASDEGNQMEQMREHVLGSGEQTVMYATVTCAGLALFFTACLAFWINSMASMIVDIERVVMMADEGFSSSDLRAKAESSCRQRLAKVTAMFCGCQGIEYLGNNDVGRLNLSIAIVDDGASVSPEEGQHHLLESMLGAFAFRSLFFGGFAYFAIDFLFTPTWYWSPFYALAMSLSFCCSVVIITISLLYTVQSGRLQTSRMRDLFASKMVWPVRAAYAMFLHALFWQLCGFILIGQVKDFDYSDFSAPDPDIDFQFFYDLATPGLICLLIAIATRIIVTNKATEISQSANKSSSSDNTDMPANESKRDSCDRMLKRMDAAANSASFCAGNVFFEILFSSMGKEGAVDFPGDQALWTKLTNHWYFMFSGLTFMLGTTVVIISTIVTVWAQALQDPSSKRQFARQMHVLSVACAKLFRYSQFSWLLAVGAMGVVKWAPFPPREQFIWVSVRWSALGLVLMIYYGNRIASLRNKVVRAVPLPSAALDHSHENPVQ